MLKTAVSSDWQFHPEMLQQQIRTNRVWLEMLQRPSLNSLNTLLKRLQRPASQSGWGQLRSAAQLPRMTNMARANAAVREFLNIWECGGTASLMLDTTKGGCTVSFTAHLGHPGALLQASPPPTSLAPPCTSPRSLLWPALPWPCWQAEK